MMYLLSFTETISSQQLAVNFSRQYFPVLAHDDNQFLRDCGIKPVKFKGVMHKNLVDVKIKVGEK